MYNVDTNGNITTNQPVSIDSLIADLNTLQDRIDQITNALTAVAQAPNVDPAILTKVNALPQISNALKAII